MPEFRLLDASSRESLFLYYLFIEVVHYFSEGVNIKGEARGYLV